MKCYTPQNVTPLTAYNCTKCVIQAANGIFYACISLR